MPTQLPTRFARRALGIGRAAASLGRAGAKRLVRSSPLDDAALGDALLAELDHLKGMAMKVGQILSYMEVGLPEETQRRLARLQRGVQPLPFEALRPVVEDALGASVETLFDELDPVAHSAASIGQVHRGVLDGQPVAVKVQYPGIRDTLLADTRALRAVASLVSMAAAVDGAAIVAELEARLVEECDYRLEAERQQWFCDHISSERIVIGAPIASHCAAEVLTTPWLEGEAFEAVRSSSPERRAAVAQTLTQLLWTTLLRHHRLHADPHPGNFLFGADGQVAVMDFGAVKEFTAGEVASFRELVRVVVQGRRDEIVQVAQANGLVPRPDRIDADELWRMLSFLLAPYCTDAFHFERTWWTQGMAQFQRMSGNARHLSFPPSWLWLQRALAGLHAVLVRLDARAEVAGIVTAQL
ncbi:MAG: AarF/ABC1/UbiB kinase family protein [Myxococcales bacterium]|nr:AarF/ABC1/UbiB kinase family protein [Myxococcales bacterium]